MTSLQKVWVALIAVAIIAIIGCFTPVGQTAVQQVAGDIGSATNYTKLGVAQLKIGSGCDSEFKYSGCTGTAVNKLLQGTCNLSQNVSSSFAASTTQLFLCTATGVASGDNADVTLPQGAGLPATPGGGFHVVSAFATTSNVLGVILSNESGAATSSFKQATTSVSYLITD